MTLPEIIQLYALMTASENEIIPRKIPQKKLLAQPFIPIVIKRNKPKLSVETWLNKNLKGFMRFMIEYAE